MPTRETTSFLPDLCSGNLLFTLALILQLVAILLCLAALPADANVWSTLWLLSLYLQWIGLCGAAVLCGLRKYLRLPSQRLEAAVAFTLLTLVVWGISEVAWRLANDYAITPLIHIPREEFLLRSLGVSVIVTALVLRYFWVMHHWREQLAAQGESRYRMLQARMRPHFLFNTLNSIVALAQDQPEVEAAILDLATLLRANLSSGDQPVRLADELELTRAYLRIEQRRLGERLQVQWQLGDLPDDLPVPALTLQPLVENAIRHGISPRKLGGCVQIEGQPHAGGALFIVSNPASINDSASRGSGEALFNLGERLQLRYPHAGPLLQTEEQQLDSGRRFVARLQLPAPD